MNRFGIRAILIFIAVIAVWMAMIRSLSSGSAFWSILYFGSIALTVVIRAERTGRFQDGAFSIAARSQPKWFKLWLATGFVGPLLMLFLGLGFRNTTPWIPASPWPARGVSLLLWVQLIHAVLGIILLVRRRWAVLGIAIVSILPIGWLGLYCYMSTTGNWL